MGKRKNMVRREANGRPQRRQLHREMPLPPPTETRRVIDAAIAEVRFAEWGTMLGQLKLRGRISEMQYEAGKKWSRLVEEYSVACLSPRAPRTAPLDPSGGNPADPDTASGIREAKRHARVRADYDAGVKALADAGTDAVRLVETICEHDLAPGGFHEVEALRSGLQALAKFWSQGTRNAKAASKPLAKTMVASTEKP